MTAVQRGDTTVGPVAIDGRTITLVARTRAVHIGGDGRGAVRIWSRPVHVEVLDAEGRREIVRIRDAQRTVVVSIALSAIGAAVAARVLRSRRSSG